MSYYSNNLNNNPGSVNPLAFPSYNTQLLRYSLSGLSVDKPRLTNSSASAVSNNKSQLPPKSHPDLSQVQPQTRSTVPNINNRTTAANNPTHKSEPAAANSGSVISGDTDGVDPSSGVSGVSGAESGAVSSASGASASPGISTTNHSSGVGSTMESKPNITNNPVAKKRKNRPGQKFGAKKKSWVWSWFIQDSQNHNVAACDLCGKIITRLESDKGSPKKLSEHLKTHKIEKDTINTTRPIPIDGNGIVYDSEGKPLENQPLPEPKQSQSPNQPQPQIQGVHLSRHPSQASIPSFAPQQQPHHQPHQPNQPNQTQQPQQQPQQAPYQASLPQQSMPTQFQNQLQNQLPLNQHPHLNSLSGASTGNSSSMVGANAIPGSSQQIPAQVSSQAPLSNMNDFRTRPITNNDAGYQYNINNHNNRRYLSPDFDNSPYSAMKFHKHLLKFLTENKLSINVIKSHSFQQLIYDLRSDSVMDLLELTGLYNSLIEVSRFENNMGSMEESNMVSTFAQAVNQKNGTNN